METTRTLQLGFAPCDSILALAKRPGVVSIQTDAGNRIYAYPARNANFILGTGARNSYEIASQLRSLQRNFGTKPVHWLGIEESDRLPEGQNTYHLGKSCYFYPRVWLTKARCPGSSIGSQIKRALKANVSIRVVSLNDHSPEILQMLPQLRELRGDWLGRRKTPPFGGLLADDNFAIAPQRFAVVAFSASQILAALVCNAVPPLPPGPPDFGLESYSFVVDAHYRRQRIPNGTSELMLHAAIKQVAERSSCDTPLGFGLAPDPRRHLPQILHPLVDSFYPYQGILRFRERMHPDFSRDTWLASPIDLGRLGVLFHLSGLLRNARRPI